jgi:stage V sporulation protein AF
LETIEIIDKKLCPEKSFDIVKREFIIGGKRAYLYFVDGFIKDELFEKIVEFFFKIKPDELSGVENMSEFSTRFMPYVEIEVPKDFDAASTGVLSGATLLVLDGIKDVLLIDTRTYPARSISEPEKDRTMRGAKDGFVETLIFNTALIRRRVRDFSLRMEYHQVGKSSKVDVAICYLEDNSDPKILSALRKRLKEIDVKGISMTQQALSELLLKTSFFNPFPRFKFTERPDYASACLTEGRILLIMDNSPSVMILPTSFADFTKEANDYYFPPFTATFIRITRQIVSISTVLITPLFLLLINNPSYIPPWLSFIKLDEIPAIPVFGQLLLLEFVIDGLRLASLNTPDNLSSSLSIIGGLLLSEFAIGAGWFSAECILYMSFVAIAGFSQPSFEMGYAQKYIRVVILILTRLFGLWGFVGGIILPIVVMLFTKTLGGKGYLSPIIPFEPKDFLKLFVRTRIR